MHWIQLNVGLTPRRGSLLPSEGRLFGALEPVIASARGEGLECFWFVRKDPALRLRFGGRTLPSDLRARLGATLATLEDEGVVSTVFSSVYEPETTLFGGRAGMDLVHRHFDLDTAAWMTWARMQRAQAFAFSSTVLTLAVMVDRVERSVAERGEIWDVWASLRRTYGEPSDPLQVPAIGLRQLAAVGGPRARPVVEAYAKTNASLAADLDALWRAGQLRVGRRGLMSTLAAFHWNRQRIGHTTMARLAHAMATHYEPEHYEPKGGSLQAGATA
ncbi:MAG: thiopeptide-type bacteriocin biosynthesis protein [Deltaproteobacteria bacterium]|nr:thiopeptide-type bacteriocin biosynthesis protein [Deltaproteobacteria bacterium]